MIVDLEVDIDGLNVDSLEDVELLIGRISEYCDTIYPINYIIRYAE